MVKPADQEENSQLIKTDAPAFGGGAKIGGLAGTLSGMGATIQGFKLEDQISSEEDLDQLPVHMRSDMPSRLDKKRKKIVSWRELNLTLLHAFFSG